MTFKPKIVGISAIVVLLLVPTLPAVSFAGVDQETTKNSLQLKSTGKKLRLLREMVERSYKRELLRVKCKPSEDCDGDGYAFKDDCDDGNPNVNPGAVEIPGDPDGVDEDCSGTADDVDGDGFLAPEDCDDEDETSYPGAPEINDRADNNCDGIVDEGF